MNGMLIEEIEKLDRNFLTPAEVSKALGISIATFYRNYKKMKFPTTRVGSRLQIPKEAFLDFLRYGEFTKTEDKQNRKPIRSFRLGDGYALEHLEYRINHKNYEMPLSEAMKYSGIQREYALCIRQIQIQLYRCPEPERLHLATYREVERSSRLLFYLQDKQIHSAEDFQKAVAAADERAEDLKNQKAELVQKISDTEKMIEEIPQYLEILNRRPLMPKQNP